tara:strand:+ start:80 stop:301 length:222 start_codon:yes stop_codon:yes gene_type:complete
MSNPNNIDFDDDDDIDNIEPPPYSDDEDWDELERDPYESITGDDDIEFFDSEGGLTAEALAFLADEDSNQRFI